MSEIKIEKNVPIPQTSNIPPLPLDQMDIGHSFVLKLDGKRELVALRQRLYRYQRSNQPVKFSARKIDDERVRVQRVQ